MNDPSGHAGAARKGCVIRPVERCISRRSQVHRPTSGVRVTSLVAPGDFLSPLRISAGVNALPPAVLAPALVSEASGPGCAGACWIAGSHPASARGAQLMIV